MHSNQDRIKIATWRYSKTREAIPGLGHQCTDVSVRGFQLFNRFLYETLWSRLTIYSMRTPEEQSPLPALSAGGELPESGARSMKLASLRHGVLNINFVYGRMISNSP